MTNASSPSRESLVDLIRGFALFGICVVNLPQMGYPTGDLAPAPALIDRIAGVVVMGCFEAKSFTLFAFILGWGIGQHWQRTNPADFAVRHLRRVAALALLGFAHALLVYTGDILLPYALISLVIWPLLLLPNLFRLLVAAASWPWGVLGFAFLGWIIFSVGSYAPEPTGLAGSFSEGVQQRWDDLPGSWFLVLLFNIPFAFAAALAGAAAAQVGWPAAGPSLARLGKLGQLALLTVVLGSLLLSFCVAAFLAWNGLETAATPLLFALFAVAALPQALGYLLMLRWLHAKGWRPQWLLAAGRNSLTCYVTQGVLAGWIFGSYGLGLYGELEAASLLGVALGVALLAAGSAVLWEKLLGRGPLEYVLKWATGTRR